MMIYEDCADFEVIESQSDMSTITLLDRSTGKFSKITAVKIDELIISLALARSTILPPVSNESNEQSAGYLNPVIQCIDGDISGYKILKIRNPGLGWVNSILSRDAAHALAYQLIGTVPPTKSH